MSNEFILVVAIVVGVFSLFAMRGSSAFKRRRSKKTQMRNDFRKLSSKISTNNEAEMRDLVIKMDTQLSKAMQVYYSNDNSFAQNLKTLRQRFDRDQYNQIWKYHKVRNEVVHDDRGVSANELRDMYNTYVKALDKILS